MLLGACTFLLIVALVNLSNFSLSMSPVRIKGVNTRKVLGASNASLLLGATERQVLSLFTGRHIVPLVVSFLAGAPVAYIMSKK